MGIDRVRRPAVEVAEAAVEVGPAPVIEGSNSAVQLPPVDVTTPKVPWVDAVERSLEGPVGDPRGAQIGSAAQSAVDVAGRRQDYLGGEDTPAAVNMLAATPVTLGADGMVQANFGSTPVGPVESVAYSAETGTLALGAANDQAVQGTYRNSDTFSEHETAGELTGTSWRRERVLGGGGTISPGVGRLSASAEWTDQTSAYAGVDETGPLSAAELEARAAAVTDRDAGTPATAEAEIDALINDLRYVWNAGDSVGSDQSLETSFDAGIAGPVGVGVGAGTNDRVQRTVEALGDGQVRVTLAEYDSTSMRAQVTGGHGLAAAMLEAEVAEMSSRVIDFDLESEDGRRDFAIMQYTGLVPGAADRLGITDEAAAARFIAAGGMDAVENGSWTLPEGEVAPESQAALNAELLEGASETNGFVTTTEEERVRTAARLGFLGINAASYENTTGHATETLYGEDGEETVIRSHQTVETGGFLMEDGRSRSEMAINGGGDFALRYTSSYDDDTTAVAGPVGDAMRDNAAFAAAVDDPTMMTTLTGNTGDLLAGIQATGEETDDRTRDRALDDTGRAADLNLARATQGALDRAAESAGLSNKDLLQLTREQLGSARDGERFDISGMSPEAVETYAILAVGVVGGGGWDVMYDLVAADPATASRAIAGAISASGPDGVLQFQAWAEQHPELADAYSVDVQSFAGSRDAAAVIAAQERPDQRAADRLLADVTALSADPDTLGLFLDGIDVTAGQGNSGGIELLFERLPPGAIGDVVAAAGDHPTVARIAASYAVNRPDLVIPQGLDTAAQQEWARIHLGPLLPEDADLDELVAQGQELAHATGVDRGVLAAFLQVSGREEGDLTGVFDGLEPTQSREMLAWLGAEGSLYNMSRVYHLAESRGQDPSVLMREVFAMEPQARAFVLDGLSQAPVGGDEGGETSWGTQLANESFDTFGSLERREGMSDFDWENHLLMRQRGVNDRMQAWQNGS